MYTTMGKCMPARTTRRSGPRPIAIDRHPRTIPATTPASAASSSPPSWPSVLAGPLALYCVLIDPSRMDDVVEGLFHVKRAVTGDASDSTESSFTKHKCASPFSNSPPFPNLTDAVMRRPVYLVVVLVGVFVVLVLAVMLSAWCCRGAFEIPCCVPATSAHAAAG
ncbi:hypothetical protein DFH07DRAFT_764410 [Mycena maculata]|uniref:Uncharacterized protein n=1 Tax=Mycena maculata TaxID=230809 RepID=A0AAD7KD37_9AGAR|nr:hypothetical protein DFH07DRAFT_764410 [Mycena maculata]